MFTQSQYAFSVALGEVAGTRQKTLYFSNGSRGAIEALSEKARGYLCRMENRFGSLDVVIDINCRRFVDDIAGAPQFSLCAKAAVAILATVPATEAVVESADAGAAADASPAAAAADATTSGSSGLRFMKL